MSSSIGVRTHNSEDTIQILENIRNLDVGGYIPLLKGGI